MCQIWILSEEKFPVGKVMVPPITFPALHISALEQNLKILFWFGIKLCDCKLILIGSNNNYCLDMSPQPPKSTFGQKKKMPFFQKEKF